jgi:tetratricopeptide (TPR) repeat protein
MRPLFLAVPAIALAIALTACSSPPSRVTFTSTEPGNAKLLPLNNLSAPGQELGSFPVSIPKDKLAGKAVQLSAKGRSPQFWVVQSERDSRLQLNVKFLPPVVGQDNVNHNRSYRVLMKAYQALSSNDFKMVKEYSMKLVELDPAISAPYILIGIAALEQGKNDEARTALNKAQVLDPEDTEIAELLKRVR